MNTNVPFGERLRYRLKGYEHKYTQYRLTTNETTIAETEYGQVKGVKRMTLYDEPYYSFEGIPYAQPPLGELRFRAPQRPTPWEGVRDCSNGPERPTQMQPILNRADGSEDCLYLNVYTNNPQPETPRPVMIWIYGGGFTIGEANREWYGPDYFMRKDVVLITVQYRLGVFGFLSLNTPDLNVPGNAGLKDQVLAIKWVKNNCSNFGGNPDCITVFGESAGGASTHYMLLTEATQGLFHRAITMSGNALAPWALYKAGNRTFSLAKLAGYKGEDNEKDILQFLQGCKAKDLVRLQDKTLTLEDRADQVFLPFGPVVEPYATPECVVPKHPREMVKVAWSNSIPILTGFCSYECLFFWPQLKEHPETAKILDTSQALVPSELIEGDRNSTEALELGAIIKKAHVTGESATGDNFMDYSSYYHMVFPFHRLFMARLELSPTPPVYIYRFDFDSNELVYPYRIMRLGRNMKGVSHADELAYLFTSSQATRMPKTSREYRTIERMIDLWTNFATTGNPNNEQINGMSGIAWEPIKRGDKSYKCLNISDELTHIELPEMEKLRLWESLYDKKRHLL